MPQGTGPVNYNYAGMGPAWGSSDIRYQEMLQAQETAQYRELQERQYQAQVTQRQMAVASNVNARSADGQFRTWKRQNELNKTGRLAGTIAGGIDFATYGISAAMGGTAIGTMIGGAGGGLLAGGAGATVGGFVGGMAAPMVAAAAVAGTVKHGMDKRLGEMKELQETASDFDLYKNSLGFSSALSFKDSTQMSGRMSSHFNSSVGDFFSRGENTRIHKIGMSSGMLSAKGSYGGSMTEYTKNFDELKKTTEEVVKALKTTIEGGMGVMKDLKGLGFSMPQIRDQVKSMVGIAGATGISSQNVMANAAAGASAVAGTSFTSTTGATQYNQNLGMLANQGSSVMAARVNAVGGQVAASGILARTQLNVISSGMGKQQMAYMMNNDGTINQDRKNKVLNGDVSGYELMTGANNRGYGMGVSGRVLFEDRASDRWNEFSAKDRAEASRALFDSWGDSRPGSRVAKAEVYARKFTNNASDKRLFMESLLATRDTFDTVASQMNADRSMEALNGLKTQSSTGFMRKLNGLHTGDGFLRYPKEALLGYGANIADWSADSNNRKMLKTVGKTVLGVGAGFLIGGVPGAMVGGAMAVGAGGNGVKTGLRAFGLIDEYNMKEEGDVGDYQVAANRAYGTGISSAGAAGLRMLDANQAKYTASLEAGNKISVKAKRSRVGRMQFAGLQTDKLTVDQSAYLQKRINTALWNGTDASEVIDEEVLKMYGYKEGSGAHEALKNQFSSAEQLQAYSIGFKDIADKSGSEFTDNELKIDKLTAKMSRSEKIIARSKANSIYGDYKKAKSDERTMKGLGISNQATIEEFMKAVKGASQSVRDDFNVGKSWMGTNTEGGRETLMAMIQSNVISDRINKISIEKVQMKSTAKLREAYNDKASLDGVLSSYAKKGGRLKRTMKLFADAVGVNNDKDVINATIKSLVEKTSSGETLTDTESKALTFLRSKDAMAGGYTFNLDDAVSSFENFATAEAANFLEIQKTSIVDPMRKRLTRKFGKSKTKTFMEGFEGIITGSAKDFSKWKNNKDNYLMMQDNGLGSEIDTFAKFKRMEESEIRNLYLTSKVAKKDDDAAKRYEAHSAKVAAEDLLYKFRNGKGGAAVKAYRKANPSSKDESYETIENRLKKKASDDIMDYNELTRQDQDQKTMPGDRPTTLNPPVLNYWNNSWSAM